MRKIKNLIFFLSIIVVSSAFAKDFTFDTRVGAYKISSKYEVYRNTRLAYNLDVLIQGAGVRAESTVLKGIGFTGESSNYRLSFQTLYSLNVDENFNVKPFIGIGLSSSIFVNNSISCDVGLDAVYKLSELFAPIVGGEAIFYSDSTIIEYYGGPRVILTDWFSFDALYTAILDTSLASDKRHNIGFGGRVNLYF